MMEFEVLYGLTNSIVVTFDENHSKQVIKENSKLSWMFNLASASYMLGEYFNAGAFYGKALVEYFDSGIWNS